MVRRRSDAEGEYIELASPATAGEWGKAYPDLWDFLFSPEYDDGGARVPGSVVLFRDGPHLKACLSDKDANLVAFVSGSTPEALFRAIDSGLAEDSLDWRAQRPSRKR